MKRLLSAIIVGLVMTSFTGCYGPKEGNEESKSKQEGDVVVATSVAVTEILDKLGVSLAGVPTTAYTLPESTKDAVKVGNPMNPDLEKIKSLNPTVVVSVDTLGDDFKNTFIENNIPSEFVTLTSLKGLKEAIKTLGDKFNKETEADNLLNDISAKEGEIVKKNDGKEKENILIIFGAPGSIMIGTSKCYVGNLVDVVGGKNIVENNSTSFVQLNIEEVLKSNPDKVLVMTHGNPEESKAMVAKELKNNPMWQKLSAVKEDKVYYLDSKKFGMSANLKVTEALDELASILNN
ncbi:heme ABC transporter substrate-binding protein IsdE [Clostridium chauvoei]|uniref:High-affinity heme uptake system protein IsdE n=2 Tax=Clostridium chauvoei TaxID=46867 RepID=S6FC41_9CLOT|nr:heme ABC transporter substrate-binding protein IsdE [Clostridium chauvoei]MBX7281124.1 heme ABC transporter substrate-binding protein IsdE [Clostridium chauvoei]MBX7283606.1 heme ABC transporter substrate-binding protein IsdE [Clostridium chauvoei]MBX7286214.1 heme ABC transporter substrate-binding protein IsdE [Clostridium chauvoei]MBX7288655.1 heme ABC transporter substrate-binding protein IsdE [Clostridium chauvoei]MBX7291199.1 heme ABC transporter substrate-binding protein IsdE [Clostri